MKTIKELFSDLFSKDSLPHTSEQSSLQEISFTQPHIFEFLERKYGINLEKSDKSLSLKEFSEKYKLPPPQILYMEIQMSVRAKNVHELNAVDAKKLIDSCPNLKIVDVRDEWEIEIGTLKNSHPMTPQLIDEILQHWEKSTPVLVYCHHGVRSMDFATFLSDRGFNEVYCLVGGIDAWSTHVDQSIPQYQGNIC